MKILFAFSLFTLIGVNVYSQGTLKGNIVSLGKPVPFANVGFKGLNIGAASDIQGNFIIENVPEGELELIVSVVGYEKKKHSVRIENGKTTQVILTIKPSLQELNQIVVTGTMKETFISDSPVKVEVITASFLQKSPTNNIMQAIETINGVQEQIGCGVCGTSDIHINGMEGPYTLVLIDGMPIMSALSTVYGLNGIATSLIERIEIIKGPSSTLYGTEAVAGVINVITKKPQDVPLIGFNAFGTSDLEKNIDFYFAPKMKKSKMLFSGNYYNMNNFIDENEDNFNDIPLINRVSLFSKFSFDRKNSRIFNISAKYYDENRFGGVSQWTPQFRGSDSIYGESIYTKRYELISSYQLPFNEKLRWDLSFNNHNQDSWYGDTEYAAVQTTVFSNLIWDKTIGARHDLIFGSSLRYNFYDDNTFATNQADRVFIPGIFAQDEYALSDNLSILAGLRFDYHEKHGSIFSPRINFKYKPATYTTLRLNAGTGFRVVNLFTEEHAALTGARTVVVKGELSPEKSYNMNLNVNHVFTIKESSGTIDADIFYTYFENKIIPDYETDKNLIVYDNLLGHSISRGFSLSYNHRFNSPFKLSAGGTFLDVFAVTEDNDGNSVRENQAFVPKLSGVFTLSYTIKKLKTSIDYTGKVMGPMELPTYDHPFERDEISPWFTLQNLQVTKEIKKFFEVYIGVRNILNYTQNSPLIDPQNPFGPNFDTAYAYGPLQGRRFFIGLRFGFGK
ncbi:MAG: TonB-dependent receptor [Bacteroidetes bacterium]|nr:TonB-dependent receptor [Bacteroidota bacterium]HET6243427.1 TonB-dependent receptor [Bacteroidia bacterium]